MNKLRFSVSGRIMGSSDAAIVVANENPLDVLVEAVVQNISTGIQVTCGGVTLHLAAWQDPDHWSEDWQEKGIEDVDTFIAGLVEGD